MRREREGYRSPGVLGGMSTETCQRERERRAVPVENTQTEQHARQHVVALSSHIVRGGKTEIIGSLLPNIHFHDLLERQSKKFGSNTFSRGDLPLDRQR